MGVAPVVSVFPAYTVALAHSRHFICGYLSGLPKPRAVLGIGEAAYRVGRLWLCDWVAGFKCGPLALSSSATPTWKMHSALFLIGAVGYHSNCCSGLLGAGADIWKAVSSVRLRRYGCVWSWL